MPGLRGREKKAFFNSIAGWMVLGFAAGGAMIGYSWFGVLGAIIGLGAGIGVGGSTARKGRFYGYAELSITGIMPSSGLCRVRSRHAFSTAVGSIFGYA
jgi:hypothetical protein